MARELGRPAVLTVLTTAVGFASNAFTDIEFIRDVALAATFGVLANGVITVLLVPMLHAALGRRLAPRPHRAMDRAAALAIAALGVLRRRPGTWALAIAAVLCAAAVQLAPRLQVSNEPLSFFGANQPLARAAAVMHEELAGVGTFYITLDANAEGAFRDPANLQRIADIQAFIAKQQVFDRSLSLADLVAQANQASANGRRDAFRVPPSRKLVAQYLLLYPPTTLAPYVSHDFRRANIVVRHGLTSSSTLNHHVRELRQAVASYAGPGMATSLVGENLLLNGAAERLLKGQALALAALLLVVFIVTSLMFTSPKGGLIALVPSLLPVLMILGIMRVLEIPLHAGTALVAIVAIVIALEGTVRLFSRYSELCRGAASYDEAVVETIRREAAPMIATSLAVAAGFGMLVLSEFALIAQFGALAAVAMLASILVNLLVTPLVMARIRLVGLNEIFGMSMQREALEHSPLFHGMTPYQIRKTILLSELREYRDGEHLIEQGTMGRSMYIVVSGQLEVVRQNGTRELHLAVFGPGDVFGEIGFVHETYRTADVRALGPVAVLCIDHERLKKDLALFPHIMAKLNFNISGILGKRLAEVVNASHASAPATPPER
jgi:predicted RND superfamily exporter protein